MAETQARPKAQPRKNPGKAATFVPSLHFTRKNALMAGVAVATVVAGYLLLGAGDMHLAAFLLVVGYLVLFPLAIVVK